MAHKGAGEETRKAETKEESPKATKTREAESKEGGGHQHGEGKTAGGSEGERIGNARADDGESVRGIPRILLTENRGRWSGLKEKGECKAIDSTL
jgi:hypothetical protein